MLATMALVIFIPVFIMAWLINILSGLFASLYALKAKESLKLGFNLFVKKLLPLFFFASTLWLIVLIALFIGFFVVSLVPVPFRFFGFLAIATPIMTFYQTAWVLAFEELVKPVKTDEAKEPLVLPEAA